MFATALAYASIATLLIAIAVAADRGQPIFSALVPIRDFRAFCSQLGILVGLVALAIWQLRVGAPLWGQPPLAWGMVLMLSYVWACLLYALFKK